MNLRAASRVVSNDCLREVIADDRGDLDVRFKYFEIASRHYIQAGKLLRSQR